MLTVPGLILISPVLAVIALAVRIALGSPVLFRQRRPGLMARPFVLYKFRTMSDELDAEGNQMPDAVRLTRLGRLLRSFSLDELPELLNVIKGEMSLAGPRPLLMRYLERYSAEQGTSTRRTAWNHRLDTGERAQRQHVGAEIRIRRLVCRPLVRPLGCQDPADYPLEGPHKGGNQPTRSGDLGRIHGVEWKSATSRGRCSTNPQWQELRTFVLKPSLL